MMSEPSSRPLRTLIVVGIVSAVAAAAVTALLVNIFERKQEGRDAFVRVVELTEQTTDPAVWGQNFPIHYDLYSRTVDQKRTRYGGSEAMPRVPDDADPRSVVSQSRLEEDPRLKTMWNGYAFAVDFREERGHAYMLEDQTFTERQKVVKQPGTCIHCHASTWAAYNELGDGNPFRGFEALNRMSYTEAREFVDHPVACIDCHDPQTLRLRVTRPAFIEGMRAWKASQGIEDWNVNEDATRHEMRAYVCGQCHVEYYFKGDEKRLTYPWANGLRAEEILAYYEEQGFKDWVHKNTGANMLKAQHPEFEMWNQGVHARNGVTCADYHMPYVRIGGKKVSDHHVRSPLLDTGNACQVCHKASQEELKDRAEIIQTRTYETRNRAMDALVALIRDIEAAQQQGGNADRLDEARKLHRQAQFLVDFIEAENSMGFHADQESVRILAHAIDLVRQAQLVLRDGDIAQRAVSAVSPIG
jgi:nitrite reductase (cytochrome c-552)